MAIFNYSSAAPPVSEVELLRIREAMLKRGPDGGGLWLSERKEIGLAHRRLSIIDLSDAGTQPMSTADGSVRIVFNGEIYNYRELRQRLIAKGYEFRSQSDTEVLLHLYEEHGHDMVSELRGMYAFAIWDRRKQGLFLVRDPFGIKPLYYADNGATIRVASQVKALLKGGMIDTRPEPAGHVGFYLWGHIPEPYTLFRGIRALPAGTTLWVDTTGSKKARQYFSVTKELSEGSEVRLDVSYAEMHEQLRIALLDTVRHHLIADVPVGMFLSSGIDSGTLTGLSKEVANTELRSITLGFKEFHGTHSDEVPLAELIAAQYGTRHETAWITKGDFQKERAAILDAMDQPSVDGVNTYFVSKAAAQVGLKVALSGLGGDELFGGYASFRQIPKMVRMLNPCRAVPQLARAFRYCSSPILKRFTSPKYAGLLEYGGNYSGAYLLRRGMFMPWELPNLLDSEMVRAGWDELQPLSRLEQTTEGVKNPHLKITALETIWYMRNQLLRDADWAGMANALEIRLPLVDVFFQKAIVPLLASSNPPGKLDIATVPKHALPKHLLLRKKTGFRVPVHDWLMDLQAPLRDKGPRGWARLLLSTDSY